MTEWRTVKRNGGRMVPVWGSVSAEERRGAKRSKEKRSEATS